MSETTLRESHARLLLELKRAVDLLDCWNYPEDCDPGDPRTPCAPCLLARGAQEAIAAAAEVDTRHNCEEWSTEGVGCRKCGPHAWACREANGHGRMMAADRKAGDQ